MASEWTEADIAAFLDGELEDAERDHIARVLETDPAAAAVAARLSETDALLREAFSAPLNEAIPNDMRAILDDDRRVVSLATARASRRPWAGPVALAASVALVVGIALGAALDQRWPGGSGAAPVLAVGPADTALAAALDTTLTGETENGVRPLASFRVAGGRVCREFETTGENAAGPGGFGLACHADGRWRVLMATHVGGGAAASPADFTPAAGVAVDAALPLLDALGAGAAMTPLEEAAARDSGWR